MKNMRRFFNALDADVEPSLLGVWYLDEILGYMTKHKNTYNAHVCSTKLEHCSIVGLKVIFEKLHQLFGGSSVTPEKIVHFLLSTREFVRPHIKEFAELCLIETSGFRPSTLFWEEAHKFLDYSILSSLSSKYPDCKVYENEFENYSYQ
jgi:hypothetical protein